MHEHCSVLCPSGPLLAQHLLQLQRGQALLASGGHELGLPLVLVASQALAFQLDCTRRQPSCQRGLESLLGQTAASRGERVPGSGCAHRAATKAQEATVHHRARLQLQAAISVHSLCAAPAAQLAGLS